MRIDAVPKYSYFWDHSSYRPLEQLYRRNHDGREEIDIDVAQFRLQTLFKIMHHSVHGTWKKGEDSSACIRCHARCPKRG